MPPPCYHVPAQPALRVGSEMGKGWHLGQGAHRSKHGVNQLVSVSALTALQAGQTRELLVQDRLHGAVSLPEATPSPPAASMGPEPGGGAEFLHLCQASASLAQKISGAVGTPRGGGNPKGWVGSWCWWVPSAGGIPRGHRQPGQCHKAPPAPTCPIQEPTPSPAPRKARRSPSEGREGQHRAWQGQAKPQPPSLGWQHRAILAMPG